MNRVEEVLAVVGLSEEHAFLDDFAFSIGHVVVGGGADLDKMTEIVVIGGVNWNCLENGSDEFLLGDGLLDEDVMDALSGELLVGKAEDHLALDEAVGLMVWPMGVLALTAAIAHSAAPGAPRESRTRLLYGIAFMNFALFAVLLLGEWLAARISVDPHGIVVEFGSPFGEVFLRRDDIALVVGDDHPFKLEVKQRIVGGNDQLSLLEQWQVMAQEKLIGRIRKSRLLRVKVVLHRCVCGRSEVDCGYG